MHAQVSGIEDDYNKKNYEAVVDAFENFEETLKNTNPILEFASVSYYRLREYDDAILYGKKSYDLYKNEKKTFKQYVITYYIGQSFKRLNKLDSTEKYFRLSLDHAKQTKNNKNIAIGINNLSIILEKKRKYLEAIQLLETAREISLNDSSNLMTITSNIGFYYYRLGILDSALQLNLQAYRYFKKNQSDPYWRWFSTFRMGHIEKKLKNSISTEYFEEARRNSSSLEDSILSMSGKGEAYLQYNIDSSYFYLSSASDIAKKANMKTALLEINMNLVEYFFIKRDLAKAQEVIEEIKTLVKDKNDRIAYSSLKIRESEYFLLKNQFDKSISSVQIASDTTSKYNLKNNLADALTQKFRVLNHFGYYKEALEVKEEEIKVREELFNDRSEAVYQILRTQNEMDKQESTIANQQLVIDNNNLQITLMYISIALVVCALVFIFWQYRTRSRYAQKLETMFLDSRHRYMNNLLLLKNWFNEGKTEKNDEIISFAQNRIDAISTVNRHLDRLSYNKDTIESKSFLEDISHNLLANREFTSEIENVPINMSISGPLGMITNEIITNGLKYGEAPYAIRFHKNGKGYILEIEDHGPGIADPEKKGTGSKVLRLLSKQLKGELVYQNKADHSPKGRGTLVSLTFKG